MGGCCVVDDGGVDAVGGECGGESGGGESGGEKKAVSENLLKPGRP